MKNVLSRRLLISAAALIPAFSFAKGPGINVKVIRRIASERYTDVNEFQLTEEEGTRYCGNAIVPKHAVHLPWLKDLRKPAGSLIGLPVAPLHCQNLLKWDNKHYCLDRMKRRSRILDLIRRCSEF